MTDEDIDEPKFTGPPAGVRVVELADLRPGPFATMLLADLGADVVRIDRPVGADVFPGEPQEDLLNRGKRSVVRDLKDPAAVEVALALVEQADVLVEGYRPAVAERIGLGRVGRHRPVGSASGARHRLHRSDGRAACHW